VQNCELKGKVALVTGAAQGIGFAVAHGLYEAAAAVFLVDLNTEEIERAVSAIDEQKTGRAAGCRIDVSDKGSVEEAVKRCLAVFRRIDILVNSAGVVGRGRIEEIDPESWSKILAVNLTGTFLCCRAVIPHMRAAGGGVILNASSVSARMPDVGLAAYCVSKGGVEIFTRVLAAEVAPYGIRVISYAPGVTETPMTRELIQTRGEQKLRHIPLRRFGTPAEIAELAVFLCSSRASFITGAIVPIDGGTMIVERPWKAWPEASEQ
jgi:NAD(P)-dependent dehydrogenase (short-subunit alcohol dehydrogenase family)